MSLICIDFETFYSKDFSLSKMTTEAYIRSREFQVIGFAYNIDGGEPVWVSGDDNLISDTLHALNLHEHKVIMHNAAFDAAILGWKYGIHPKFMFDTMGMAKPVTGMTVGGSLAALAKKFCLGEKGTEIINALGKRRDDFTEAELAAYGEYCRNDVTLTYNLFHVLQQWSTPQEMYIIDLLLRMYTDPVIELAENVLVRHLSEVQARKAELMERLDTTIGKEELMSNDKFAQILRAMGVEPPMKISAATGKEAYAFSKTDVEFKALLEHPNDRVQTLMAARFGTKSTLEETRTESFIQLQSRGSLPIMLMYWGAHTGRASGGDKLNLQNLPRGGSLRYSMRPPAGHIMIASDSSQIEARILGWWAGEAELTAQFAAGDDVYSKFATDIYGRTITKADKIERFVGKVGILSLGFGVGKDKFRDSLKTGQSSVTIDNEEAERIVSLYRAKYAFIAQLWKDATDAIKAMSQSQSYELGTGIKILCDHEGVHLPNGMLLRFPNLSYRKADGDKLKKDGFYYDGRFGPVGMYGAKLIENIVQALARIVVFNQMAKIDQNLKKHDRTNGYRFKVCLTVHDEVVAVVPEQVEKKVVELMVRIMSIAPKWAPGLPIACEAAAGTSYGDVK